MSLDLKKNSKILDVGEELEELLTKLDNIEANLDQYEISRDKKLVSEVTMEMKELAPRFRTVYEMPDSKEPQNAQKVKAVSTRMKRALDQIKVLTSDTPQSASERLSNIHNRFSERDVTLEGFLLKKGAKGVTKKFKKRWFYVDPIQNTLIYKEKKKSPKIIGEIPLTGAILSEPSVGKGQIDFSLTPENGPRIYELAHRQQEVIDFWITGLTKQINPEKFKEMISNSSNQESPIQTQKPNIEPKKEAIVIPKNEPAPKNNSAQEEAKHWKLKYDEMKKIAEQLGEESKQRLEKVEELEGELKLAVADIKYLLDNPLPANPHKWVDNAERTHCYDCNKKFTFFTFKHHCRNCAEIFCDDCSSQRVHVPHAVMPPTEILRVCDTCAIEIDGEFSLSDEEEFEESSSEEEN